MKVRFFLSTFGALLAGTKYRGDFNSKDLLNELKQSPDQILFIDEIPVLLVREPPQVGDGRLLIWKPLLASGEIRCLGSTTYQEYRGIFDKDRRSLVVSKKLM